MDYRNLGRSGLKVSRICLGAMTYGSKSWREWVLEEAESLPYIERALELGINFFDTADMYSVGQSEVILGKALGSIAREDVVVATKCFNPMGPGPNDRGLSRKHVLAACDASLKRLQMDYIDLYQIHRFDYETPIEETIEALDSLVNSGKVRYLGASSMYSWQFMQMIAMQEKLGLARFVSMQPQYNLIYREEEREMLPLCRELGVGVIPWSPLARGFLTKAPGQQTIRGETDAYSKLLYTSENDASIASRLREVARTKGSSPAQVALAWVLSKPGVTAPIVGASKPQHLEDAVASLAVALSDAEIQSLEELYIPHTVKDHG